MIYSLQTNLLFQNWLKPPFLQNKVQNQVVSDKMQESTGRRVERLEKMRLKTQEMGGQENTFIPLWREMLHHCGCSSHTTSCRAVRKCLQSLSQSFVHDQALGSE